MTVETTRVDLQRLLAQSQRAEHEYRPPPFAEIDWGKAFVPESFTQLFHTPFYALLTRAQRLRYNQLYGLRCNELFMVFEKGVTEKAVACVKADCERTDPLLARCLDAMLREEERHHAMFLAFNHACLPDAYELSDRYFSSHSHVAEWGTRYLGARRGLWPLLLWIILILEESSTAFSRMLSRGSSAEFGELEQNYVFMHRLHLKDEVRHVQLDALLVERLLEQVSPLLSRVNAGLFRLLFRDILAPKRSGPRVLMRLLEEFPELGRHRKEMSKALRGAKVDLGLRAILVDRREMPLTHALLDAHPRFQWDVP